MNKSKCRRSYAYRAVQFAYKSYVGLQLLSNVTDHCFQCKEGILYALSLCKYVQFPDNKYILFKQNAISLKNLKDIFYDISYCCND